MSRHRRRRAYRRRKTARRPPAFVGIDLRHLMRGGRARNSAEARYMLGIDHGVLGGDHTVRMVLERWPNGGLVIVAREIDPVIRGKRG